MQECAAQHNPISDAELAAMIRVAQEEEPSRPDDSIRFLDALLLPHRWQKHLPETMGRETVIGMLAGCVRSVLESKTVAQRSVYRTRRED
jgi:hypothetical protein